MKYSMRDIISSLPKSKNSKSSWWVKLWVRRFSFIPTYLFANLGWKPNYVSYLSAVVSLIGCALLIVPSVNVKLLGAILINIWLVLDCVDGNIARVTKIYNHFGEWADALSGYMTLAFLYFSMGMSVYFNGESFVFDELIWVVIIGFLTSMFDILSRLVHVKFNNVRYAQSVSDYTEEESGKRGVAYIRKRVSKELGLSGLLMPLLLFGAYFSLLEYILYFYFIFNFTAISTTVLYYIYKTEKSYKS